MHSKNKERNPEETKSLEALKLETAAELGISLPRHPGEKLSARDAGRLGGHMVRKLIRNYERTRSPSSDSVKRS